MHKILYAIVGVFVFLFSLAFPSFAATISITDSPTSATLLQEFNASFSGSGLNASSTYYAKVRIGQAGPDSNPYNQGETKSGDSWLGDGSAWENFSTFTTDSSGVVSGSLTARAKSTASLGNNSLFVRLHKVGTTTNIDSTAATITLTAATPTPTPTPTPSPSPTATPKPTTAASSTSTPKPTNTPSPTPLGTSKITTASVAAPTPESLVLGVTDVSSASAGLEGESATPEASAKKTGPGFSGKQYLAEALAITGILFLGASAFLFFNERKSSKIKDTDEAA